ncbi:sigma-54-dependent Fis family transcriptional regulator [Sulfoacidibacillus thermotolerans]|uniref:Sigma-54 factor interaction domain-containing protein n=1 Tax=Sulfoacidibacillus thermotolerans TaxID=1765684 RepID=A0A2U3D975_SULT2|nr:sigma-54-dependent Fis family transcriptional regulator [Sulfoacidibacillus thermotolerans]PWI57829.1 hypothetical protein BM613_06470 [Sulfoacidibacillus thermotolerans]
MHSQFLDLTPENLYAYRNQSDQNWSRFLSDPNSSVVLRPLIRESWARCLREGINPLSKETYVSLASSEIESLIQRSQLYEHALPTLQQLTTHAQQTGYLVTLSDKLGRIIYLDGDHQVLRQAELMNFTLGADWSEQAIGTNAIGTSLAAGEPVQVFAAEHFCSGVHDWVCSSAPIRDPLTRETLGAIDVTGPWKRAQSHTLGMITTASRVIEDSVYSESLKHRLSLLNEYSNLCKRFPSDGVLLFDNSLHLVECNYAAQQLTLKKFGLPLTEILKVDALHSQLLESAPSSTRESYGIYLESIDEFAQVYRVAQSDRRLGFILVLSRRQTLRTPHPKNSGPWSKIIGRSPVIKAAINQCDIASQTDIPILLQGESGTGKELFAHAIHEASPKHAGPFVAINCGAIPKDLLASELFGYEPGTFTGAAREGRRGKFEEAQNGTLFLDEIGEMPLDAQVYLLRVLQEKEVVRLGGSRKIPLQVRIVAATNRSLQEQVYAQTFRSDLYYRLNVINIALPPLRERRDDIPLLTEHLLTQLAQKHKIPIPVIADDVLEYLVQRYTWRGNIRELQNVLEHATVFCQNNCITWDDLPLYLRLPTQTTELAPELMPLASDTSEERAQLAQLLKAANGNLSELSRKLGVARSTVYRRLRKYGLIEF